jgi:WD40 repeat protein
VFKFINDKLELITKKDNANEEDVNCVAFSRLDNCLISCSDDNTIDVWEVANLDI